MPVDEAAGVPEPRSWEASNRAAAGAEASASGASSTLLRRVAGVPTPLIFSVSVVLAVAILWRAGSITDVRRAVRNADGGSILSALALYVVGLAMLCARWHLLVRMVKGVSHAPKAAEAFLTSVVINYAAPIGLAVPSRAALTKRALGLTAFETGAVALWEITVDVAVLGAGALLWLAIGGHRFTVLPGAAAKLLIAAVALLLAAGGVGLARRRPHLLARALRATRGVLAYPVRRPADATLALGTTVVYWVAQGIVLWLLLRAIGEGASASLILGLITLPVLVGMLSPVPGGAGIREALMLAVARVHDAGTANVLLAALTYRIALFGSLPVLYGAVRVWLAVTGEARVPAGHGTMSPAPLPPEEAGQPRP